MTGRFHRTQRSGRRRIPSLALLSGFLLTGGIPARALETEVVLGTEGKALVRIQHAPVQEPLGALRLKLRFKDQAGVGELVLFGPEAGPWSQVQPELRRDGRVVEILALAPTVGDSRQPRSWIVAQLAVTLTSPIPLRQAADLLDSAWVEEALLPWGGRAETTLRLTTSARTKMPAFPETPRESIRGGSRILSFALAKAGRVRVRVLDSRGRMAVKVFDGTKSAGMHEIGWDGRTDRGRPLPAGTYFLRLEAGTFAYDRKLEVVP